MQTSPRIRTRLAVQVGGYDLQFRPLTSTESESVIDDCRADPDNAIGLAIDACRSACVGRLAESGDEAEDYLAKFDAMSEYYPLACSETILQAIINQSAKEAQERISDGVRQWKAADRNPGRMAEHLLALKAYEGGDYTAGQFAGALAVAELISTTKGIATMIKAYLNAMKR